MAESTPGGRTCEETAGCTPVKALAGDADDDTAPGARTAHEGILRHQSARESAARTYARALPIVPVRARGLTIEGADGRRYLDCLSGAGTLALGHNHPVVLEAIRKVLDSGAPLNVLDLATPVKDAFVTELFRTLPPGLADRARVRFCGPADTDALGTACELARAATGRTGVLAFTGAGHGRATESLEAPWESLDAGAARATPLPYPQDHRRPFGVGDERGADLAARWTESLLDDTGRGVPLPAGVIVEPDLGGGGVIPTPDAWLRRIRQLTADRSVPLIVDETQTGVGRTGAFWAVEHSRVTPDVMVLPRRPRRLGARRPRRHLPRQPTGHGRWNGDPRPRPGEQPRRARCGSRGVDAESASGAGGGVRVRRGRAGEGTDDRDGIDESGRVGL